MQTVSIYRLCVMEILYCIQISIYRAHAHSGVLSVYNATLWSFSYIRKNLEDTSYAKDTFLLLQVYVQNMLVLNCNQVTGMEQSLPVNNFGCQATVHARRYNRLTPTSDVHFYNEVITYLKGGEGINCS